MGPNGSGKSTLSHVLMGRPGYEVTSGRVTLDGVDLLGLPTWRRAQAGLFLGMQYPIEVPGVSLTDVLVESGRARGQDPEKVAALVGAEAARVGFEGRFLSRWLNVDLSGGERKRTETVQLGVLQPRYAVLDEIDSASTSTPCGSWPAGWLRRRGKPGWACWPSPTTPACSASCDPTTPTSWLAAG